MANLEQYKAEILSAEDLPIFLEAIVSARAGAMRGAYVLLWISCAESLKRKFREASSRDHNAAASYRKILELEEKHRSADKTIIDKAKSYGFISDVVHQKLEYIYTMRSIYGHPYESAPDSQELESAASVIVKEVLSKPTLLKEGFIKELLQDMISLPTYLENTYKSVCSFAKEVTTKIDPTKFDYLLLHYAELLEPFFKDATLLNFRNRGCWFLLQFLRDVGCGILTAEIWHTFVINYPLTARYVLTIDMEVFEAIGMRARDSIIADLYQSASENPSSLIRIEKINNAGLLSPTQSHRFNSMPIRTIAASGIGLPMAYPIVIDAFKRYAWDPQNTAAEYVIANLKNVGKLDGAKQEELGRNALQAAEGDSGYSRTLVAKAAEQKDALPMDFKRGLILEAFFNESGSFRLKARNMKQTAELMSQEPKIVSELTALVTSTMPKTFTFKKEFNEAIEKIAEYDSLTDFANLLQQNSKRLRFTDERLQLGLIEEE